MEERTKEFFAKAVIWILVIIYILWPMDIIPDSFFLIGYLDDIIILILGAFARKISEWVIA